MLYTAGIAGSCPCGSAAAGRRFSILLQSHEMSLLYLRWRFLEGVKAGEFAAEGAAVGGPLGFAGVGGQGGPWTPWLHRIFLKITLDKRFSCGILTLG